MNKTPCHCCGAEMVTKVACPIGCPGPESGTKWRRARGPYRTSKHLRLRRLPGPVAGRDKRDGTASETAKTEWAPGSLAKWIGDNLVAYLQVLPTDGTGSFPWVTVHGAASAPADAIQRMTKIARAVLDQWYRLPVQPPEMHTVMSILEMETMAFEQWG